VSNLSQTYPSKIRDMKVSDTENISCLEHIILCEDVGSSIWNHVWNIISVEKKPRMKEK